VRWRSSGGVILFQRQGKSWEITLVDRAGLAAELEALKPLYDLALAGNDLRLPDQGNGHHAQGNNAKHENEGNFGFVDRKGEGTPKPRHG